MSISNHGCTASAAAKVALAPTSATSRPGFSHFSQKLRWSILCWMLSTLCCALLTPLSTLRLLSSNLHSSERQ